MAQWVVFRHFQQSNSSWFARSLSAPLEVARRGTVGSAAHIGSIAGVNVRSKGHSTTIDCIDCSIRREPCMTAESSIKDVFKARRAVHYGGLCVPSAWRDGSNYQVSILAPRRPASHKSLGVVEGSTTQQLSLITIMAACPTGDVPLQVY